MHLPRWFTTAGAAHTVIKHKYTRRAQGFAQEALNFRVVDAFDLVRRVEVSHLSWRAHQLEPVTVEREFGLAAARVFDQYIARIVDAAPGDNARRRFADIAYRLLVATYLIMQRRSDAFRG
jgi:hypothetical protein